MRSSLIAAACALGAAACILPEDELSTTATFHVWCQTVSPTLQPIVGVWVNLSASKYDYGGAQDPDTVITSGEATASYDPLHPGTASFVVGYTLHRKGDDEERAEFTCSTLVGGAGGSLVSESDYRGYSEVVLEGTEIDVAMVLGLP